MSKKKYQIYCDMDGVLVDYMGGVLPTMNNAVRHVADNLNLYKTKHSRVYKATKKAVADLGGELEAGNLGKTIEYLDVCRETEKKRVRELMYALVSNDFDFWANLGWMHDGQQLWSYIVRHNPTILTGPQGPNSKKGKIAWCRRELGLGKDRVIVTQTKHEEVRLAVERGVIPLLIDDLPKYVVPFRNAGGMAIQHTDTVSTIDELRKLGL